MPKPLTVATLDAHIEQCIIERASLHHLYQINWNEGEQEYEASMKPRAAASIWRAVQDAITEAGWKLTLQADL